MDVREKLVEQLREVASKTPPICRYDNPDEIEHFGKTITVYCKPFEQFQELMRDAADYIAHSVTVQEWISVDDRLPKIPEGYAESPDPVLYMMKNTKTIYAGYYGEGGVWKDKYFRQYADGSNGVDADDVLCWMYQHDLPQPPKGE